MRDYLEVANGSLMFLLCGLVIIFVIIQAVIFIRVAWKRGAELGIESSVMKKTVTNSAVFSIIPSLPIVLMLMVLSVPLGKYFPWLRLSVIGSAAYENMAADTAARAAGLSGIADPGFNLDIFVMAMWIMTLCIIWGIVFNIIFMRRLDSFSQRAKARGNNFVPIMSAALFLGMLSLFTMPYVVDYRNLTAIVSIVSSGTAVVLCGAISKRTNIRALRDFSMPISLLIGMGMAIVYTQLFVA